MFDQAQDFLDESEALAALLEPLPDTAYEEKTLFKDYSVHDVVAHLHVFNRVADLSLTDRAGYDALFDFFYQAQARGESFRDFTDATLDGARNRAVFEQWRAYYPGMAERMGNADPKTRVPWAGREMSLRSSVTARLMETWAHGQEIYDHLGVVRRDGDRIQNIAVLGINTFGFNHQIRKLEVPPVVPHVRLHAPSGAVWEWNPETEGERIQGSATEFCQVVTQTRNVADTALQVEGPIATRWMQIAQCFAGAAMDPPAAGERRRVVR